MRTRDQIENKLDKMIKHLNQRARLSPSEKFETANLLNELKVELIKDKETCLAEIELLSSTELYSQIDSGRGTVIRFRPRNNIPK